MKRARKELAAAAAGASGGGAVAAAAGVTKSPQKRRKNSAASDTGPARAGLAAAAADQAVAEGLPKADALAAKDAARLKAMIVELKAKHDAEFAKEKLGILSSACQWASTQPHPLKKPAAASAAAAAAAAAGAAGQGIRGKYARCDSLAPNATGIVRRRVTSLNTEQVIVRNVASTELPYVKPLAGSCAWIGLKKNFKVHEDDEDEVPRFIPYFGDAASDIGEEAVRLFTNSKLRIKLPVNPVADKVYAGVTKMFPPSEEVLREIGISFGLPVDYFTDRYPSDAKAPDEAAAKAEKTNAKAEYDPKEANKRLFDSYKNLFCRRCYVYDCRDHGAGQPIPDCRDDAAMSIINTGTVLANAPLVQAMTISKADLQRAGAGGAVGGDGGQSPTDRDAASPVLGQSAAAPSARARRLPDSSGSAGLKSSAKASASGQASVAAELEEAFCSDVCYRCFSAPKSAAAAGAKWSDIEEVSFSKSVQLCGRAPCRVSRLMRSRTCAEVWAKMEANPDTGEKEAVVLSKAALLKRQQQLHIARRNAYYKRHKLMEKTAEPGANSLPALGENALPEYVPCRHEGACTVENGCACAKKNMMCEKFCACSSECKNRWAGCTCKRSRCNTRACPCYAAGRECDPDLCHGCGACLHPESIPDSDVRRCLNVPLQTGHHKHLWLGPSGVHGWGGFVTQPLEKNEFIHEYVGETISQQEAERRGRVYDVQRLSFLFNLSDTTVVDATRKGNKTKFINHASSNASRNNLQANVEVRYVLARGERHVCMYAQRDIAANEELFFDYNYTHESHQLNSPAVVAGKAVNSKTASSNQH